VSISEEYVNVADAMKRIGGNMDLYKRLLNQFTSADHFTPLEQALSDGAHEEASRLVHTLKGTCANLSLSKLAASAADLEHKVKSGLDHSESLDALKQVYNETSQHVAEVV